MQRILIVTDNPKNVSPWQQELVRTGYPVQLATAQPAAIAGAVTPRAPEIVLLDGTSTRLQPAELRALIERHCPNHESAMLWLITDEIAARFDPACGVDDFLVLPAAASELLARIRLHLWRSHRIDNSDVLTAAGLVIDQSTYTVTLDGRPLELTFKEYELLRYLVTHRGRVFNREALLNQVWGYDYYGGYRTVDVHIRRIRAKLGPEREDLVETIRNVGYRFNG